MRTAAVLFPNSCGVSYGLCLKKALAGEWEVEGQGREGDKPPNSLEFGWFRVRKMCRLLLVVKTAPVWTTCLTPRAAAAAGFAALV